MASRKMLYVNASNDLQEMTSAEMVEVQNRMIYAYGSNPTAVLTQVSSSGALVDSMDDTRLKAGATSQSTTAFVAEASTAEPATVTVTYDKINLAYTATGSIDNDADDGTTFPVYYDSSSGNIIAMTLDDVKDTLLHPAIDLLISGTESSSKAGTYTITDSSTAATNYTNVSTTAVFANTIADTSAYSSAGIPETLDQPTTVTSFYLHRRDASANTPSRMPVVINAQNDFQQMSVTTIDNILGDWLRYTAAHSADGYKITYNADTSGGNTRGTAMGDTKLNGSGNYQTLQSGDDYRSQEFPNGSAATVTTYNLRINKT